MLKPEGIQLQQLYVTVLQRLQPLKNQQGNVFFPVACMYV